MSYQPEPISHSTHVAQDCIIVSGSEGFDGRSRVETIYYLRSDSYVVWNVLRYVAHDYWKSDGVGNSGS